MSDWDVISMNCSLQIFINFWLDSGLTLLSQWTNTPSKVGTLMSNFHRTNRLVGDFAIILASYCHQSKKLHTLAKINI